MINPPGLVEAVVGDAISKGMSLSRSQQGHSIGTDVREFVVRNVVLEILTCQVNSVAA